ncbi:hypothetical protein [Croceibacter atlanticus]|uniref:hypothetical protein n=1 Tax=Croceibacter atlanticus TaxID=313588 RepID=UPI0030D82DD7|tara:strand:- start:81351 stop:81911 length:561 start_codon:yes stop_codon:yes gene_type:complete
MIKFRYFIVLVVLCLGLSLTSCIDDVDFEQGESFIFYQNNTVSLIHFEVNDQDFTNPVNNGYISDVTRLNFLDDGFIQENLVALELYIEYNNTFSQDFNTTLTFLSEEDEVKYPFSFIVDGSPDGSIEQTIHIEQVPVNMLDSIRQSIKLQVEIELIDNGLPVEGGLSLRSKADFILEIGGESTGE